mgnify:CR=1 FL=1
MANNSIYNVPPYRNTDTYVKNAIVFVNEDFPSSSTNTPKTIKYYYALKDLDAGTSVSDSSSWGGLTKNTGTTDIRGAQQIPEFIWVPSYNATVNSRPKVNTVVFGNGYEQRIQDGIHNNFINFSASFEMRGDLEARAITHFLKARKGTESFVIRHLPPIYLDGNYKKRFYCQEFATNFVFHGNHSVRATFIETNN